MEFSALPPEINSALMYSGPGSGPLMAAAAAWDGLAAELHSTASAYSSGLTGLTGQQWQGPASAAMMAAATRYVAWMTTTAAQAEQVAVQAKAAAGAYEVAFATTVPPAVVAANRALLMSLVATNILGQNTPAIAATEAQYGEMWAQDVAAMENYAGSSAAASTFAPFTAPPKTTNPAGATGQAAAVTQAATPANGVRGILSELGLLDVALFATATGGIGNYAVQTANLARQYNRDAIADQKDAATPQIVRGGGLDAGLGTRATLASTSGAGSRPALVSASTGRAASLGGLSVPQSWATPVEIRQLARVLPMTNIAAAPAAATQDGAENPYTGMALAGLLGSGMGGLAAHGGSAAKTAVALPATANFAAQQAVKPVGKIVAAPTAGAVAIPTENIAASLAATLAAMPGATIVVIPPPPASG
jgi:PPE-repeat protein